MDYLHIYDLEKIANKKIEFNYLVVTHIQRLSFWDKNAIYYGFIFTVDNEIFKVKIPYNVYKQIPDNMKYIKEDSKRFKIDEYGQIENTNELTK